MANKLNSKLNVLGFLCLVLLVQKGSAYSFIVGDQKGWGVPSDPSVNPYNQWAEKRRFQKGDSLVFNYKADQDSVLQVKSEDYAACNTDSPIAKYSDGHTVFTFKQSGAHYFISGNKDNCNKNEKLIVIVLADRSNRNTNSTASSPPPAPAPSEQGTPSSPPTAPAPSEQGTPSSPPTATSSPSPGSETPSPSGASSVLVNFAGIGAFMASSLVFSL